MFKFAYVCVSVCMSASACEYHCVHVYVSGMRVNVCMLARVCMCLMECVCVCGCLCVCECVCLFVQFCVSICVCVYQCYVPHICHWCKLYMGNILICQFSLILLLILFYVGMHVWYQWIQWNHKGKKSVAMLYSISVSSFFIV